MPRHARPRLAPRRARGSAGRCRPRTGAPAAGVRRSRGSSRSRRGADPRAQLAGCAPCVRDHEDGVDVEPALADAADEPLDEHRGLARPGAGGDEDLPGRLDGRTLLLVHARGTRHIGQRSHHAGHSPPFGSCTTSPPRIRCPRERAVSRARSTAAQKASSSR